VIHPFTIRFHLGLKAIRIPLNLVTVPVLTVLILLAAQCIPIGVVRDGIIGTNGVKPYNVLILFFSLAYMAITLDLTGVLQAAAFWVSNKGGSSGWRLFSYFYVLVLLLAVFMGNDPVILSGTAFLVYYTRVTEVSPTAWLFSEFTACNTASMVLFVGNPTNVILCEGFGINYLAYSAYTIVPFLFCSLGGFAALCFQFRSREHLPRQILSPLLDPKSVLHDPFGAWVGAIMLILALLLIIGVSFVGVDVWEVALPFALSKLLFDFSWDYYRLQKQGSGSLEMQPQSTSETQVGRTASNATEVDARRRPPIRIQRRPDDSQVGRSRVQNTPVSWNGVRSDPNTAWLHYSKFQQKFPTFTTALPRLPFALLPFAFAQFTLVEALAYNNWITVFAHWLEVAVAANPIYITVWLVGVLGVALCNISGTNIGATILMVKVLKDSKITDEASLAGAIALAVASNIGALGFAFAASLAGLLWRTILAQKQIKIKQRDFARWNILPLLTMTIIGLSVVSIEMRILYPGH